MAAPVALLGAGSWGTALAILAARNGCQTLLWGHTPAHVAALARERQNRRYLPGFAFPDNLAVTASLAEAAAFSPVLLVCVPSHAFQATLAAMKPHLLPGAKVAWATKGFASNGGLLLHQVVAAEISADTAAAAVSGPSFAAEVAAGLPTAITVASPDAAFADELAGLLHNAHFRTYTSADLIGVEVGGAVKNVLAIAAGIADGLGFGANTRAALITRGLTEMIRLGVRLGGQPQTFMGLAGLGDLVLTCTDNQSRNRRFGFALGQGRSVEQAMLAIGQQVEGVPAAKQTHWLAQQHALDMPITEQTYKVLYQGVPPQVAVEALLARTLKQEC